MNELQQLLEKYKLGQISHEELLRLHSLIESDDYAPEVKADILNTLYQPPPVESKWKEEYGEAILEEVFNSSRRKVFPFKVWQMAAAMVAGIAIIGGALLLRKSPSQPPRQVAVNIQPGSDKAMLVLADGRKIPLDSSVQGSLAQQGSTSIVNTQEGLSYQSNGQDNQVVYNTVVTPRGGQYQLTLADGTKVWLNAASSIRFPTSFDKGERSVELTGEGYFQVAANASQPFKVKVKGNSDMSVDVLGTSFNIMAYPDEQGVVTTLESGAVQLVHGNTKSLLAPGYGGTLLQGSDNFNIQKADLEQALAWKDGKFRFRNTNIYTIMRQISRWYNIDVAYEGELSDKRFTGLISRRENASSLLQILSATKLIDIEFNGNKILVRPHVPAGH